MIIIKLPNSFTVYTDKIENVGYIDFKLCFNTGLVYEQDNQYGITHLLEHMLFRGIGKCDYESLEKCFRNMGTEVYGKTGYDYLSLSFSVLPAKINEVLLYLNELYSVPNWTSDDLRKEKEIIIHELNIKETNLSKRIRFIYDNILLNKSVMGCASSIKNISLSLLKKYHSKIINPNNSTLFISGDISDESINTVYAFLSKIKNNNEQALSTQNTLIPQSAFNRKNCYCLDYDNYDYSDLYINFDVDSKNQSAARFIQYYLSGYTSPLSEIMIDENTFSYELYSHLDEWKDFSILSFAITCKYDCLCKVIDTFKSALLNLINDFSEDKYNETVDFIMLEKRKALSNPEMMNELKFCKYFYGIDYEIPTYRQVLDAMKSVFSSKNLTVYSTYCINRKNVVNSILELSNAL